MIARLRARLHGLRRGHQVYEVIRCRGQYAWERYDLYLCHGCEGRRVDVLRGDDT